MLSAAKSFPAGVARAADTPRPRLIAQATFIVVIAVALRAYDLGLQSLWTDELFSRYYGDLFGLKFLWTTGLLHEDSPPLYYMALEGWMHLFGAGEAAIRSLSLVASVLTLPLVYLIGRELSDARRGLLAMLIFALSPMQIGFAQEARTYALLLIPIGMVLLAVARLLRRDLRYRVLCLYGTGAITALYCHATAVIFIAACNIVVIGAILSDRQFNRSVALTRWIIVNALVGLAAVPELVAIVVMGRGGIGIEWIPPFRPVHLIRALSPVIVGTSTPDRFPGAELSLLLLACLAGATHAPFLTGARRDTGRVRGAHCRTQPVPPDLYRARILLARHPTRRADRTRTRRTFNVAAGACRRGHRHLCDWIGLPVCRPAERAVARSPRSAWSGACARGSYRACAVDRPDTVRILRTVSHPSSDLGYRAARRGRAW